MNPTRMNSFFKRLHLREIDNKGNLQLSRGNIFRDYHFREFKFGDVELAELGIRNCQITDLVVAEQFICVIYNRTHLIPFTRIGEISACKNERGKLIVNRWDGEIEFACYNSNNKSLLTVVQLESLRTIISTDIESIISGKNTGTDSEFLPEKSVVSWKFDIANSRGMVHFACERVWRVFELYKYTQLFTIPFGGHILWFPGKVDMLLYEVTSRAYPQVERYLRIYCKLDGHLRKKLSLRGNQSDRITLCGRDRLVIQPPYPELIQIIDISSQLPRLLITIPVSPIGDPFCLDKKRQIICRARNHINNIQNRRGLVMPTYSVHVFNLEGVRFVTLRDLPDTSWVRYISENDDVVISVSTASLRININCILSGESLLTTGLVDLPRDDLRTWIFLGFKQFAYDERTHEIFMVSHTGKWFMWSNKFFEHH